MQKSLPSELGPTTFIFLTVCAKKKKVLACVSWIMIKPSDSCDREASDLRNGIFFIHCEIFKSYGTCVYVFCSICMDFWGDWNLPGDF